MSSHAQIAINRFGLGSRAGDRRPSNAKQWLIDQFEAYQPTIPALSTLKNSAEMASLFIKVEGAKSAVRAANRFGPVTNDVRGEARAAYSAQAAIRIRSAIATDTPFLDRIVHFWANHFAISAGKVDIRGFGGLLEFEAIRPHVLGNFADLLLAVERHPAMLIYLDQAQSVGPMSDFGKRTQFGLNENLGREILELHTLGVDGGYSQADVRELSLAMTGWTVAGWGPLPLAEQTFSSARPGSFAFTGELHEPGVRQLMGRSYPQAGVAQAEAILRDLVVTPVTARHLVTKLARHFVSDNPPASLIGRLETAFRESGGDLPTLYRGLIDAPECWRPEASKFRSPWLWGVALLRATRGGSPASGDWSDNHLVGMFRELGQPVWNPGSPAGFEDDAGRWATPAALMQRVGLVSRLLKVQSPNMNPLQLGEQLFPSGLTERTLTTIATLDGDEGLALLLLSPEMMRV